MQRRSTPELRWRAVIAGIALAVIVDVAARYALAPIPGLVATMFGIGLGGFMAGKWADSAGLYHGAIVGAGWIALSAVGLVPTPVYAADVVADTVTVIWLDLATLAAASLGGWIARRDRSSS
ncbi:MAG TPA: hypothetical protein VFV54_02680, partial [Thermoanaerobaculia bacterium]|nr:hypothetical protein [Thermoanaerobaculia bacterium]